MFYAIKLTTLENGKIRAECPDLRGISKEDYSTASEAMSDMCDCVPGMMYLGYRKTGEKIPLPTTKAPVSECVYIPARVQAKILLWNLMVEKGIRVGELAKQLGVPQATASRLTDMTKDKASMDAIENALIAVGGRFNLSVEE